MKNIEIIIQKVKLLISTLQQLNPKKTKTIKNDDFSQIFVGLIQNITNSNNKS